MAAPAVSLPEFVGACRIARRRRLRVHLRYTDNLEALEAAGAEIVAFDPLHDRALPPSIDGLMIGGGFPEVYGEELAANRPVLADAAERIGAGLPTWAECGGLLWLATELDGRPMVGAVPTRARLGRPAGPRLPARPDDRATARSAPQARSCAATSSTTRPANPAGDAVELSSRFGREHGRLRDRGRCSRPTCTTTPAATRLSSPRSPARAVVPATFRSPNSRCRPMPERDADDIPTDDPRPDSLRRAPVARARQHRPRQGQDVRRDRRRRPRGGGRGWNVAVVQFLKSGTWRTGEEKVCKQLGVEWWAMGEGFTWDSEDLTQDQAVAARRMGRTRKGLIEGGRPSTRRARRSDVPRQLGLDRRRRCGRHDRQATGARQRVCTGRNAAAALIEVADTVSEVADIKHAYKAGIRAKKGIDY